MPCYEHQCSKCNHIQEEVYSMAECDSIKIQCDKCKGKTTRLMSGGVQGWVSCRTLGHMCDLNTDRMSADEKHSIDAKRLDPKANQLLKPEHRTKGV